MASLGGWRHSAAFGPLEGALCWSPAEACRRCFDKFEANEFIKEKVFALPSTVLRIHHPEEHLKLLKEFLKRIKKRAVVKPATVGRALEFFL